jgi:hypothetical protein
MVKKEKKEGIVMRTQLAQNSLTSTFLAIFILLSTIYPTYAENYSNNEYVNAIYKAEGGEKAKKPYGILSVPCNTKAECRQICYNTVRNNKRRYKEYGHKQYDTYLEFLASRYAPVNCENDNGTNKYWIKNVKYFLKQGSSK